jgi:diguanylate cyclase (GGDEF)-like protein/PAS domain S-box-containing protein
MSARLPNEEAERLAALHFHQILDTSPTQEFDDLVRLAAQVCGTPIAAVSLVDAERQWFKSIIGLDAREITREDSFCAHTILQSDVLIIQDTRDDARFADNPLVTGSPHVRFYAGAPLITTDGYALGSLCVVDRVPRQLLTEQEAALRVLARHVTNLLELARPAALQEFLTTQLDEAQIQRAAAEAERLRLAAIVDSSEEAILAATFDGTLVSWNSGAERLYGYTAAEILGRNASVLAGPDEAPHFSNALVLLTNGLIPERTAVKRTRKDGSLLDVSLSFSPIRDVDGNMIGVSCIARDITARKKIEAELAESHMALAGSQARLAEAQRLAHVGNWEYDIETDRNTWSDEMFRLFEIPPAEGEPSMPALMAHYHPADVEMHEAVISQAIKDGLPYEFDIRVIRQDGTVRWAQAVGRANRDDSGRVVRLFGTLMDIHERKLAEERFRVLFEQSSDAQLLFDEGGIVDCNPATIALLRCKNKDQVLSLCRSVLSPEFQPDGRRSDEKLDEMDALAHEHGIHRFEWTHRRMNGEEFTVEVTLTPVTLGDRPMQLVVWHDLAEHKQAQRESEERFRTLFETMTQGVVYRDAAGAVITANPAAEDMLGLTASEMAGSLTSSPQWQAIREDGTAFSDEQYPAMIALRTGRPVLGVMMGVFNSGRNQRRWLRVDSIPQFRPGEERPHQVHTTFEDITERVEREQQVRDANLVLEVQKAQLQAANEELAALVTTDPLTGLLNYRAFQMRLRQEADLDGQGSDTAAVVLLDLDDFGFFNEAYGHALGDVVLRYVAEKLKDACEPGDAVAHFGNDEFTFLMPNVAVTTTPNEIEARLRTRLGDLSYQPRGGTAIPLNFSMGAALLPIDNMRHDSGRAEALRLAEERLRRAKTGADGETEADRIRAHAERSLDGFSMLDALVTAVDNKDRYTRRHCEDVLTYSLMIARELGLSEAEQHTVAIAALLHDVGKIGVPDSVLRKPGRLTDEEFEAIKPHPVMGAALVSTVPGLEDTLDAVRHHHERWDGRGYPSGLRGEACPRMARLMAVADAFSAMTTDRPYRKGMAHTEALSILKEGGGAQWDAQCVTAFLKAMGKSTGKIPGTARDALAA